MSAHAHTAARVRTATQQVLQQRQTHALALPRKHLQHFLHADVHLGRLRVEEGEAGAQQVRGGSGRDRCFLCHVIENAETSVQQE